MNCKPTNYEAMNDWFDRPEPATDDHAGGRQTDACAQESDHIPVLEEVVETDPVQTSTVEIEDTEALVRTLSARVYDRVRTDVENRVRAALEQTLHEALQGEDEALRRRVIKHVTGQLPRMLSGARDNESND